MRLQGPGPVMSVGPRGTEKCGVGCGYVRSFSTYYNQWKQEAENTQFLLQLKALGTLHGVMLHKLRAHLWAHAIIM
jgi:hypothetical protein